MFTTEFFLKIIGWSSLIGLLLTLYNCMCLIEPTKLEKKLMNITVLIVCIMILCDVIGIIGVIFTLIF